MQATLESRRPRARAPRELADGSTAIVRGALDAGCDFFAGYPITPASQILAAMVRELPKVGGVAVQAEDEIASIGMCIGAALCGARALTATSGPGLSLCGENVGLAIQGEVPLVVVDVQRMGPATGAATSVAQGDVQFVRWGTSGGYPLVCLAPSSVAECYALTQRAFELAERLRTPVFLLTDKELNLTACTVDVAAYGPRPARPPSGVDGEGGNPNTCRERVPERETEPVPGGDGAALYRFEPPEGVAPLARFGAGRVVRFTGSSHDERAYITKDPDVLRRLNEHLVAKIEARRDELELVTPDLEAGARTLLVAYGVTAGAVREAVARVRSRGGRVSALVVQSLWPVPERALGRALEGVERVVVCELNPGLYLREVERVALRGARKVEVVGLRRLDGETLAPDELVEAVR